jgi:hypothetical protein
VKERDERETHTERDTRTEKRKRERERERERREEGKIETRKNGKKPLDPNLTLIAITIGFEIEFATKKTKNKKKTSGAKTQNDRL